MDKILTPMTKSKEEIANPIIELPEHFSEVVKMPSHQEAFILMERFKNGCWSATVHLSMENVISWRRNLEGIHEKDYLLIKTKLPV